MSRWGGPGGVPSHELSSQHHPLEGSLSSEYDGCSPLSRAHSDMVPDSVGNIVHGDSHISFEALNEHPSLTNEAPNSQGSRGYLRSTMTSLGSFLDSFKSNSAIARYGIETTTGLVNKLPTTVKEHINSYSDRILTSLDDSIDHYVNKFDPTASFLSSFAKLSLGNAPAHATDDSSEYSFTPLAEHPPVPPVFNLPAPDGVDASSQHHTSTNTLTSSTHDENGTGSTSMSLSTSSSSTTDAPAHSNAQANAMMSQSTLTATSTDGTPLTSDDAQTSSDVAACIQSSSWLSSWLSQADAILLENPLIVAIHTRARHISRPAELFLATLNEEYIPSRRGTLTLFRTRVIQRLGDAWDARLDPLVAMYWATAQTARTYNKLWYSAEERVKGWVGAVKYGWEAVLGAADEAVEAALPDAQKTSGENSVVSDHFQNVGIPVTSGNSGPFACMSDGVSGTGACGSGDMEMHHDDNNLASSLSLPSPTSPSHALVSRTPPSHTVSSHTLPSGTLPLQGSSGQSYQSTTHMSVIPEDNQNIQGRHEEEEEDREVLCGAYHDAYGSDDTDCSDWDSISDPGSDALSDILSEKSIGKNILSEFSRFPDSENGDSLSILRPYYHNMSHHATDTAASNNISSTTAGIPAATTPIAAVITTATTAASATTTTAAAGANAVSPAPTSAVAPLAHTAAITVPTPLTPITSTVTATASTAPATAIMTTAATIAHPTSALMERDNSMQDTPVNTHTTPATAVSIPNSTAVSQSASEFFVGMSSPSFSQSYFSGTNTMPTHAEAPTPTFPRPSSSTYTHTQTRTPEPAARTIESVTLSTYSQDLIAGAPVRRHIPRPHARRRATRGFALSHTPSYSSPFSLTTYASSSSHHAPQNTFAPHPSLHSYSQPSGVPGGAIVTTEMTDMSTDTHPHVKYRRMRYNMGRDQQIIVSVASNGQSNSHSNGQLNSQSVVFAPLGGVDVGVGDNAISPPTRTLTNPSLLPNTENPANVVGRERENTPVLTHTPFSSSHIPSSHHSPSTRSTSSNTTSTSHTSTRRTRTRARSHSPQTTPRMAMSAASSAVPVTIPGMTPMMSVAVPVAVPIASSAGLTGAAYGHPSTLVHTYPHMHSHLPPHPSTLPYPHDSAHTHAHLHAQAQSNFATRDEAQHQPLFPTLSSSAPHHHNSPLPLPSSSPHAPPQRAIVTPASLISKISTRLRQRIPRIAELPGTLQSLLWGHRSTSTGNSTGTGTGVCAGMSDGHSLPSTPMFSSSLPTTSASSTSLLSQATTCSSSSSGMASLLPHTTTTATHTPTHTLNTSSYHGHIHTHHHGHHHNHNHAHGHGNQHSHVYSHGHGHECSHTQLHTTPHTISSSSLARPSSSPHTHPCSSHALSPDWFTSADSILCQNPLLSALSETSASLADGSSSLMTPTSGVSGAVCGTDRSMGTGMNGQDGANQDSVMAEASSSTFGSVCPFSSRVSFSTMSTSTTLPIHGSEAVTGASTATSIGPGVSTTASRSLSFTRPLAAAEHLYNTCLDAFAQHIETEIMSCSLPPIPANEAFVPQEYLEKLVTSHRSIEGKHNHPRNTDQIGSSEASFIGSVRSRMGSAWDDRLSPLLVTFYQMSVKTIRILQSSGEKSS